MACYTADVVDANHCAGVLQVTSEVRVLRATYNTARVIAVCGDVCIVGDVFNDRIGTTVLAVSVTNKTTNVFCTLDCTVDVDIGDAACTHIAEKTSVLILEYVDCDCIAVAVEVSVEGVCSVLADRLQCITV